MSNRLPLEEYDVLRKFVLDRDGWKCRYCNSRTQLHVHHTIYRSQGGPDEAWNLVTLDEQCHSAMHSGDLVLVEFEFQVAPFDANYELKFKTFGGWKPQ